MEILCGTARTGCIEEPILKAPRGNGADTAEVCVYYLAVNAFTAAYAAYPIIDRYMIEPYRTNEDTEETEEALLEE